jgi:hypothetical protein
MGVKIVKGQQFKTLPAKKIHPVLFGWKCHSSSLLIPLLSLPNTNHINMEPPHKWRVKTVFRVHSIATWSSFVCYMSNFM